MGEFPPRSFEPRAASPGRSSRGAAERQADLIVVGARGREERGYLIGSVSQKVKALALADVLVVRRGAPVEEARLRTLLAVDGSPDASGAC
ncbi:MAG: universal stress protein [Thermoanaerobaculia bacterium]